MREKLKHLEIKKKKIAIIISTIASSLILLSTLVIILSAKHPGTEIEKIRNILNLKIQISVLQIILLFIFSMGIAYTIYFLRKHYVEIAEKIKKIKKGIKAEEDALKILKEHLKLQNIQTNTAIKNSNNNNIITDIDILATSEKLNSPISIEIKGLKGTVKIEDNKLLFQDKPLNLKQIKTIKEHMERTYPSNMYKIMIFFPYAKIETDDKQKREELKQKGYTEIEISKTKVLISNSYFIKNL
jgi:hypothetical protein